MIVPGLHWKARSPGQVRWSPGPSWLPGIRSRMATRLPTGEPPLLHCAQHEREGNFR